MKKENKATNKKINISLIFTLITIIGIAVTIGDVTTIGKENITNEMTITDEKSSEYNQETVIENIPEYSGKIIIDINNNIPYFQENEITTDEFENYSELDELNRAQVAFANISNITMPPKDTKRGSLSYKPTGWEQYLYGENNNKHLYERCHLIAWQLGNENNNKKNLITGTTELNAAMIEYENTIADWIKQKNKENKNYHVMYRVTPIYRGENKLATGVEIEAKSVEEEGVSFNKFIYNIHDDFEIDYVTGKAKLKQ